MAGKPLTSLDTDSGVRASSRAFPSAFRVSIGAFASHTTSHGLSSNMMKITNNGREWSRTNRLFESDQSTVYDELNGET